MAMPAADRILELVDGVLSRRSADPALVAALVQQHVPESLYHEYKRGRWFTPNSSQDIRAHVSAFANAEGGVLMLGIVGGEDAQGAAKWTFEPPTCPEPRGDWGAWLGRVLSDVATKTRVESQVVQVDGKDVVLIAANRAQELIRVYEKPRQVCYLRVADNTVPIEETLYADLALGRRAKPDLTLEELMAREVHDSNGFRIDVGMAVHNQGLLWVPDLSVVWIGYTLLRGAAAVSTSLKREIDLRPLVVRDDMVPVVTRFNSVGNDGGRWETFREGIELVVKPFELKRFAAQINGIPFSPASGQWAWCGAFMVLPKNGSPLWAQVVVFGYSTNIDIKKAWALPPGTPPIVAWLQGDSVLADLRAWFDLAVSK